ncbi:hypothetical protein Oweho_1168 [Owenweeksia hongkongensis DSM 17368]|uniref:Secretion system C-terminal sorting domain-containing protein n=1 Tax=Owenweeksia hongkongensis (strain DSM 17368 / CIP 108786 / JCM 12287 / NRRL B-23963 / UST20020801) TaxID=926562 RepID=G8R5C8_OWEHD|nr:LamG-like jellyroll fold domain-containing protein [Owenweeksia hongkongensis]AEV32173.1 hypothetical protein Oweho_1168 [Owenweeksia hongkongensis DSM 17368]
MKTKLFFISLILGFSQMYAQVNLSQGLIAAYPMDGNPLDTSGSSYHGTTVGNMQLDTNRFGQPNEAYHFDGQSYIQVLDKTALKGGPNIMFSFAFWFKPEEFSGNRPIISKFLNDPNKDWGIRMLNGFMDFGSEKNYSTYDCMEDSLSIKIYDWNFCVVSVEGASSQVNIWINGLKTKSCNTFNSAKSAVTSADVEIGRNSYAGHHFEGSMDYILIYNRVLTPAEINVLYTHSIDIKEFSTIDFKIYPNPASNHLSVDGDLEGIHQYQVLDMGGKKVFSGLVSGDEVLEVDISSLPKGGYLLSLLSDESIVAKKIFYKD